MSQIPDLTLIVPCHNEEDNIPAFFDAAVGCLDPSGIAYEMIFVNDGSSDGTMRVLRDLVADQAGKRMIQVIGFSRNFGKESGLYAGLQAARGRYIGLIDADMQQDPVIALRMYRYLQDNPECDVVAAYQEERLESPALCWFKRAFYRTFNAASDEIDIPADMSDFRVFRRSVGEALLSMPEYFRFSKGLFSWVGFNTHAMPYTPNDRNAGESSWSFRSLFHYAMGGILSFTTWPLKIVKYVGVVSSVIALVYLAYVLFVDYMIMGIAVPGYPTLVCLILLFGGVQLLVLGVMGDYMARDYIEGKRRPIYIARERLDTESVLDGTASSRKADDGR
jgi:glycosyltransferase involved in cell wall biosynthesis